MNKDTTNDMPEYDVDGKKIDALYRLNSATMLYDMPECEIFGPFEGADIMEVIEECQAWRETHATDLNNPLAYNPNYCAAKEALKEHLQHCSAKSADLTAPEAVGGEVERLREVARMVDQWGNGLRHHTAHESKMVKSARKALQQPAAPAVDLEKLKRDKPYTQIPNCNCEQCQTWDACIDHLAAQGMIKGVE